MLSFLLVVVTFTFSFLLVPSLSQLEQPQQHKEAQDYPPNLLVETIQSIHPLWLRERCLSSFYADIETHQPKYNLHEEVEDLKITNVVVVVKEQESFL